jgi:nucleotide-binding universal stress UspA family protein
MNKTNIQNILIPVDFLPASESAMEYGALLAKAVGADILLLHIMESEHTYPKEWFMNVRPVAGVIRKKVSGKLGEYARDIINKYGVSVKSITAVGKPANKIAEIVALRDIDLIVMGTHGVSGFEELFVGHNAHKVVNLSPCPVITVREGFKTQGIKTIVLPIDESLHSRQKVFKVLPIASACQSVVHVLGIIQGNDNAGVAKLNIKINSVEKEVKKNGLKCIRKVVKGDNVAIEAMNYAYEVKADLLSIMTDHESDLPGAFMGAFAHQIVNHSKVPVMSIKPVAGFFSYPT